MPNHENPGRPDLRLVRDPELQAIEDLNVRIIEAYCDELLMDENGYSRKEARYSATRFRHSANDWSSARFWRDEGGYALTFFSDKPLEKAVYEIIMQPYYPAIHPERAPAGAEWYIRSGKPGLGEPYGYSFDPADFRYRLEELWGQLPVVVQEQLGINQGPHPTTD
jgi:hypothetical protein